MSDLRSYSRQFIADFIELYRENSCLWKINSKDYNNKTKKAEAYELMCDKLREIEPDATRDSVVKKINSIRSCFRKELKKVKASVTLGDSQEVYKPTLWYFDLLLFLCDYPTDGAPCADTTEDKSPTSHSRLDIEPPRKRLKLPFTAGKLVCSSGGEEHATYGKYVSEELRKLPKDQALFCQKIMNDAIFEARMGTLSRRSAIVTEPIENAYYDGQSGMA